LFFLLIVVIHPQTGHDFQIGKWFLTIPIMLIIAKIAKGARGKTREIFSGDSGGLKCLAAFVQTLTELQK
jgi:hypothetical protein